MITIFLSCRATSPLAHSVSAALFSPLSPAHFPSLLPIILFSPHPLRLLPSPLPPSPPFHIFCYCWTHTEEFGLNYIKQTEELRYFKAAHILKYSVSRSFTLIWGQSVLCDMTNSAPTTCVKFCYICNSYFLLKGC